MDDKGFVFTADATLALVVVIVFTASVVVYAMLPFTRPRITSTCRP
jgi:hypothetical protein